ncbi:hypothetical protein AtNW77_Chr4g0303271 [Arabidopsis thaliana]
MERKIVQVGLKINKFSSVNRTCLFMSVAGLLLPRRRTICFSTLLSFNFLFF